MGGVRWAQVRNKPGVYVRTDDTGRKRYRAVVWAQDPEDHTKRKQIAKTFDRVEDAKDWREDYGGTKPKKAPPKKKVTLRELLTELHDIEQYAENTLTKHALAWQRIERAHLADLPVTAVTKADVDRLLGSLKHRPETAAAVRSLLSLLFVHAIDTDRAEDNPVANRRRKRTRKARQEARPSADQPKRYLTEEELVRLVAEAPERYRALVELMAYMGLRPGEALALRVGKFDPLRRTLLIDTALYGGTKTGESRALRLPATVAAILVKHLAKFSDPADAAAPMFPRTGGTAVDSKNSMDAWRRRHFTPAAVRAGINHGFSPNDLRHSAASFAIANGANVYDVQRMLGHAKPSITLDIYGGLWQEKHDAFVDDYDKAIRSARKPVRAAKVAAIG